MNVVAIAGVATHAKMEYTRTRKVTLDKATTIAMVRL